MIQLQNLSFSYGEQRVLENFNLTVGAGECVCLFGPSGCGKTTVLRLILGLESAQGGMIHVPDKISVVFQEDRLLPWLSVRRNVCLPLDREAQNRAQELLKCVGLEAVADQRITTLSGGMQRRVALVRALAYQGDALVLDEPFNGLDADNKQILADIIRREYIDKNKPVILVSHSKEDARLLNAKIIHM